MRILLVASHPGSERVKNTVEALITAGHTILFNLQSSLPDAVIAFDTGSAFQAAQAFPGIPLAVYPGRGESIRNEITGGKTLYVFHHSYRQNRYMSEHGGKATVIPEPVTPLKTYFRWSADSRTVILPGPFDHAGGHRTLFKALALLPGEQTALIWGDKGDYTSEDLLAIAEEEGVSDRVSFTVTLPVCTVYAAVFPCLSGEIDYDGSGGVMALGIPLLLSSASFHSTMVIDGVTGLFHSPGNHRQLAGQMDHLMHNSGLSSYLSRNAAEYCRNELSPEAVGRRWTEELEQLCSV